MIASKGKVSTAPTDRRRVMLTSSGLAAFSGNGSGLKGHAANRTSAGTIAHDLRMHRAGVFGALAWSGGFRSLERHAAFGAWARLPGEHRRVHRAGVPAGW